jgi:hypothetical protein
VLDSQSIHSASDIVDIYQTEVQQRIAFQRISVCLTSNS